MSSERVLLPTDVLPTHYSLELTPNLENLDFFCDEEIHVRVTKEGITSVSLHAKEIFIESASFESNNNKKNPAVVDINYSHQYTTVTLVFDGALAAGEGKLHIRFRGILNGDMCGFYKSSYADANGNKKIMASTQFESLDARR
jgi:aminopeptidase N